MDDATKTRLADDHFNWFCKYARWKYGSMGEEYAGIAFMRLVETYDPTRSANFRIYAKSRATFFFLNNQRQSENGKDESRRGVGRRRQLSLDDREPCKDHMTEELEDRRGDLVDLGHVLSHIDTVCKGTATRAARVCQVLGLFDDADTAQILGRRSLRGAISE